MCCLLVFFLLWLESLLVYSNPIVIYLENVLCEMRNSLKIGGLYDRYGLNKRPTLTYIGHTHGGKALYLLLKHNTLTKICHKITISIIVFYAVLCVFAREQRTWFYCYNKDQKVGKLANNFLFLSKLRHYPLVIFS